MVTAMKLLFPSVVVFIVVVILGVAALFVMGKAADLESLKTSSASFARDLFSVIRKENKDKNVVISPISLQIALAVVDLGAKTKTREELSKALHVDANDENALTPYKDLLNSLKDPVLAIATTYFLDKTVKLLPAYETNVSNIFGASSQQVDFSAADGAAAAINDWCAKNTNNKIMKLFDAKDLQGVVSVLANAVHFKAKWKSQFDPAQTRDEDFKAPTGVVKVKMMHSTAHYNYADVPEIGAQVLELPYQGDKFRMLIVLPHEDTNLSAVEDKLDTISLVDVVKKLNNQEVRLSLPKFKIEQEFDLVETLKKLGVSTVFSDQADLSGISESPLRVSKVKQKVFIQVDEEGTEAAAVTAVRIQKRSLVFREEFLADRPFGVVISYVHPPSTAVFVGAVVNPLSNIVGLHEEL